MFSAPMVKALLAGTKTQTRRLATSPLRRVQVGDRLWVRETFAFHWACDDIKPSEPQPDLWSVRYTADDYIRPAARDGSTALLEQCKKLRPAIHMPRWASRLTLEVTDVRFQPLHAIDEADCEAEGIGPPYLGDGDPPFEEQATMVSRRMQYRNLWNSLHAPKLPWNSNPDVVALTFDVHQRNIDA